MARRTDRHLMRMGAIALLVLALAMAASFNLQKFPGFRGTGFHAELTDASGLHVGNIVEIAGIRVGRVNALHVEGTKVVVDFDVHHAELGDRTTASVQVLNLLGEKYLQLVPKGSGTLSGGSTIPLDRTSAGYDIVGTLGELTHTTEKINKPQLSKALSTLATTIDAAAPQVRSSFTGLSRLSRTIASRDGDISALLTHAQHVTHLIDQRKGDLVTLMKQGDLVFRELIRRRAAIHSLLVNARTLAVQLRGLAADNQKQIGPALDELHRALTFLNQRKQELSDTIKNYGPYASILINIIGTGPWFDAYVPNLVNLATGEFAPGKRTYK
ncbi:MCE family protein [Nocardioides terrisoli]|uniref:MCE family protein n=1 Tax=Nocardioides terrisoli TaxID=3388267 RepID=UPI00287B9343|nr:MCE family protein [Nocardioides marmorisolisilvae]